MSFCFLVLIFQAFYGFVFPVFFLFIKNLKLKCPNKFFIMHVEIEMQKNNRSGFYADIA